MTPRRQFARLFLAAFLATSSLAAQLAWAEPNLARPAPEASSGVQPKKLVRAGKFMAVTAHPEASKTAQAILARGGSAVDAMIAAQLVLGLVEPQSSGLGGGAFLVHYDAASGKVTTLDGRETAPAEATPELFLTADGEPMNFFDAVIGGRSVGTPGTVALLAEAHRRHGKLPWASLFEPAIALAEKGFQVSPRLSVLIQDSADSLFSHEASAAYFMSEEGVPLFEGTILQNPAYADTLRQIAANGEKAFYEGPIASDIVDAVRDDEANPGKLSLADLAAYRVRERDATCVDWLELTVCGMGPPSSGMTTIGQILKLTEPHGLAALGPDDPQSWRIIGDATRLAFADREVYVADPEFFKVPKGLLNKDYLAVRSQLLSGESALPADAVTPGEPPSDHALAPVAGETIEFPSTSHLSIVDAEGNAVSLTTTIENGFGSRLFVRGFLLNNELTDFSFLPQRDGKPVANRVEPGKRPRSSMAPTIVLKDGKPVFIVGSPGGSRIINFVAEALIAHFQWGMDAQAALDLPHLAIRTDVYELEAGTRAAEYEAALQALGYETKIMEINSGLHAIAITPEGLEGGADPRREGVALGR